MVNLCPLSFLQLLTICMTLALVILGKRAGVYVLKSCAQHNIGYIYGILKCHMQIMPITTRLPNLTLHNVCVDTCRETKDYGSFSLNDTLNLVVKISNNQHNKKALCMCMSSLYCVGKKLVSFLMIMYDIKSFEPLHSFRDLFLKQS